MRSGAALLLVLLTLVTQAAAPAPAAGAMSSKAISWTVDQGRKTITVRVQLRIYLGPCVNATAPGGAEGGSGSAGLQDCDKSAAQIGDLIKKSIEKVWNRGHHYRCYALIFVVNVSVGSSRFDQSDDAVGVRIDRSPIPVRSWVSTDGGGSDWHSNDPGARHNPENDWIGHPAWGPTTWAYPASLENTYAHEFGHVLGLSDTYVEGSWGPKPGAPNDLMTSATDTIAQETIDRVVERNADRLYDTKGRKLELEDLKCEHVFRIQLGGTDAYYGASNTMNTARDCPSPPTTSSTEQTLGVESQKVEVNLIESADYGALGYTIVPAFDVLLAANGLSGRARSGAGSGLVDLPISVVVQRDNSKPASKLVPELWDLMDPTCASGGDPDPRPADCGRRTYDAWMSIGLKDGTKVAPIDSSLPQQLQSLGYSPPRLADLYKNCTGPEPWPGHSTEPVTIDVPGDMPTLDQLLKVWNDWAVDGKDAKYVTDGAVVHRRNERGRLVDARWDWDLTFCPVNADGDAAPGCA